MIGQALPMFRRSIAQRVNALWHRSQLPPVALKIAHRKYASTAFREIRTYRTLEAFGLGGCASLSEMIEAFPHDGHVCISLRLHGRALSHSIPRKGMSVGEVKHIARQILSGLSAMHAVGLIHTDVKPGNILYDPVTRIARLADLGLVTTTLTNGEEVATCDYTPPEGILGTSMTAPIDLWSLGCTIYKMLTGELLFDPWRACESKYEEFQKRPESSASAQSASTHGGNTFTDVPGMFSPGQIVAGKYLLKRKLGEGKFGTVWHAAPLHSTPVPTPDADEFLSRARARLAAEVPKSPSERWDLYEVSIGYEHLLQMIELLGPIPEPLTRGEWRSLFCKDDGSHRFGEKIEYRPLARRLATTLSEPQATAAACFLESLLCFDPALRATAQQALESSWLA